MGRQTESLAKDVIWEVAAAKRACAIAAFGPMVKCRSGSLCTDVGHTFQLCDISISELPVPDFEGAPQVYLHPSFWVLSIVTFWLKDSWQS